MNMYDTKIIRCAECDETIGETDFDAEVMQPKCGKCITSMHNMRNDLTQSILTSNKKTEKPIELSVS